MELSDALLSLVRPLEPGGTLDGARLERVSTELGLRLTFADGPTRVHVEVFPAEPERPHAARSARLLFAYRLGRGAGPVEPARGQALCRAVAELARPNEDRVLDALAAEAAPGDDPRVREVRGGRLLEPAGTPDRPYFTLSPYVGCLIGCRFCYAQRRVGLVRRLRGLPDAPWGSYVDARVDAPERLREELRDRPPHPIKLCPIVSDPYHAIERRLALTRGCLEVLRDAPARPVFVLTRARLVERDADILEAMPEARVGFSIPTADDAVRRFFEPRAASIPARFEVLRALRRRGVRTFAIVQPPLPGDLTELADGLAGAAGSVSLDVLRGEEGASALFDAHPEARDPAWQAARVEALREALRARGVPTWQGELPGLAERGPPAVE
ncbi:MAG TPA: radical SAM protein [Sandaracinaceae bacterium LLY-WYZ-13_1]|nr:radical SAM protein [Sandaracinaceae bacterium LLY-WYZ-13_1]